MTLPMSEDRMRQALEGSFTRLPSDLRDAVPRSGRPKVKVVEEDKRMLERVVAVTCKVVGYPSARLITPKSRDWRAVFVRYCVFIIMHKKARRLPLTYIGRAVGVPSRSSAYEMLDKAKAHSRMLRPTLWLIYEKL